MQLSIGQLQTQLQQQPLPALLCIFGDSPLLVDDALQLIRAAAKQQGVEERLAWRQDKQFDWQQLNHSSDSLSLFSSKKLVELELPEGKPGRDGGEAIRSYAASPNQDQILVLYGPKLRQDQQKAKWFQVLSQTAWTVQANAPYREQLPRFVLDRAKRYQLTLAADAAQLMSDWYEGNLLALDQQLQKLALSDLASPIDAAAIRASAEDQSQFTVFALQDAIISGQTELALRRLQRLLEEGEEVAIMSWMLQREWQTLRQLEQHLAAGGNFAQACKALRIWPSQQQHYQALWQRCQNQLGQLNHCLAALETAYKRDDGGDIQALLTHIVLLFCSPERVKDLQLP